MFYGKKLEDYGIVPPKYELLEEVQEINLISEEMNYDINELNTFLTREEKNLNVDQKNIYDIIIKTLNIFNSDTNQIIDQTRS